jgi:hypothetical protein
VQPAGVAARAQGNRLRARPAASSSSDALARSNVGESWDSRHTSFPAASSGSERARRAVEQRRLERRRQHHAAAGGRLHAVAEVDRQPVQAPGVARQELVQLTSNVKAGGVASAQRAVTSGAGMA